MMNIRLPELCLRLGIIYLLLGLALGVYMGMHHDFAFMPVHAHLNLLGFACTFLLGLFLKIYPATLDKKSARISLITILLSVPVSLVLLAAMYAGHTSVEQALGLSTIVILGGYGVFAFELFRVTAK